MPAPEVRSRVTEVRALEDEAGRWIVGYGLVFNEWSQDLGGFVERVLPGACDGAINADLVVCGNHDSNNVLGRVSAGTVMVTVDTRGVEYRALVNESDPIAVAFYERVKRGDIKGSSFSFWVERDRWYVEDGATKRDILAFRAIDEMGPVTFPAYLQTSSEARAAVRGLTFSETLADQDDSREASWLRFYQLETAVESTVLDCLYEPTDDATVLSAIDDFAAAAKEWFTAHRATYGGWYPSAERALPIDAEVRAVSIAPEQRGAAEEDPPETDSEAEPVPGTYHMSLTAGLPIDKE